MAESPLASQLAEERSRGIRLLLGRPFLDVDADRDDFRFVARHRDWLVEWFEMACGWQLVVDVTAGFARLAKRGSRPDASRGPRRIRGSAQPFDRRRYELFCLVCAELTTRAATTIGILAGDIASATAAIGTRFDSAKQRDRTAFVDALKLLASWGVLRFEGGDIDAYVGDADANAVVAVDTARMHRLPATARAPSSITAPTTAEATEALAAEPRYGAAATDPSGADEEQRLRWTRHSLARRVLDDPAVYLDELSEPERDYIANPSGRRWLRDRIAESGLQLEERAEGFVAVDPDELATDIVFPGTGGTVKQVALLLIDRLVVAGELRDRDRHELVRYVRTLLARHAGWAKEYREGDGPERLADAAITLLEQLRLVVREAESIRPRPALARYAPGEPSTGQPVPLEV